MSGAGSSRANYGDRDGNSQEKKPLNKQKWRTQQYSHKAKLDVQAQKHKSAVLSNYYKTLLKEDKNAVHPAERLKKKFRQQPEANIKNQRFRECEAAKEVYRAKVIKEREEREKVYQARAAIVEKVKASKARRLDRYKKISAHNAKGQPVMKGRLQLLLAEIQKKVGHGTWK